MRTVQDRAEQSITHDRDATDEVVVFKQAIEWDLAISRRIVIWDLIFDLRHAQGIEKGLNSVVKVASLGNGTPGLLGTEQRYI